MDYQINIRLNHQLVGVGHASDIHARSSYGLPVIVVTETDRYYGDHKGDDLLPAGVYGPADLPPGARIYDGASNGTPQWIFAQEIRDALINAGYTVSD